VGKLKIGVIEDEKPVTITIKLPPAVHRDLIAYAEVLKRERGQAIEPSSLIAPMLARFMATDRAFRKARRQS
jgi:hypothetical protein